MNYTLDKERILEQVYALSALKMIVNPGEERYALGPANREALLVALNGSAGELLGLLGGLVTDTNYSSGDDERFLTLTMSLPDGRTGAFIRGLLEQGLTSLTLGAVTGDDGCRAAGLTYVRSLKSVMEMPEVEIESFS